MNKDIDITTSQQRQKLPVSRVKPGMKLVENVKTDYGGTLIPAGVILDEKKIAYIRKNGINFVTVQKQSKDNRKANVEKVLKIEESYEELADETKKIFTRARQLHQIDADRLVEMTYRINDLLEDKESKRELIYLFNKVQDPDTYLYHHAVDVGILAGMYADWLNRGDSEKKQLVMAGFMHDIGKTRISRSLLQKEGALNKEEFERVKFHARAGYELMQDCAAVNKKVARGVLTHHERYDGSGYPLGLSGEKIPLFGRILAVADVFDAATSRTVYNEDESPFAVIKHLTKDNLKAFDVNLCDVFKSKMRGFYSDVEVRLSDGSRGEIVFINPREPEKPIIEVRGELVDLHNSDLEIIEVISD